MKTFAVVNSKKSGVNFFEFQSENPIVYEDIIGFLENDRRFDLDEDNLLLFNDEPTKINLDTKMVIA